MVEVPSCPSSATLSFEKLRFFSGNPKEFWPALIQSLTAHAGAAAGVIVLRTGNESWRVLGSAGAFSNIGLQPTAISALADKASREKFAFERIRETETGLIGLRLESGEAGHECVAVLATRGRQPNLPAICAQLQLLADTPLIYQNHRRLQQADRELVQFTETLDLMLLLNAQTRFGAVAMMYCNELASRFKSLRVSLGWLEGRYMRLQAISHMENFGRRMEVVQQLEAAMEEALDQDEEIIFPAPEGNLLVIRDHENFAAGQKMPFLTSIPLRIDGSPVAIVTLERQEKPFNEGEIAALRLLCDQAARRLHDLKQNDCWWGKRCARRAKNFATKLLGPEHTWAKVGALAGTMVLSGLIFIKVPYRIEAPFIIRTESLVQITSPVEGYVESVSVRTGDTVKEGQILLRLDARDLQVEEARAVAELRRFSAEAEQAESEGRIADSRVARERAHQADAALSLVRMRLARSEVKAPANGVIVLGDWREKVGSPVRRGDSLFKIARIEHLYPELKVSENDVHEVIGDAHGEIAFTSRPDLKFPFKVQQVEPVAVAESSGNIFLTQGTFAETPAKWWRPGMSGLAKVEAGNRSILWVLTHRAIDFLRMRFWW